MLFHIYLQNTGGSVSPPLGTIPEQIFLGAIESENAEQALNIAQPLLRPDLPPYWNLQVVGVPQDIINGLGDTEYTLSPVPRPNQNTGVFSGWPGSLDSDTFSDNLLTILTSMSTGISKQLGPGCVIDFNSLIACLLEIYEQTDIPRPLLRELNAAANKIKNPQIREKFIKFYKLYLGFKYGLFKELRVPLIRNTDNQDIENPNKTEFAAKIQQLEDLKKRLDQRIKQIMADRNIDNKEDAIDTDPVISMLKATIALLEEEILADSDCLIEECYVDIDVSLVTQEKKVSLGKYIINNNVLTISHSYYLTVIADLLKQGISVPIVIKAGPEYANTLLNPDVNILVLDRPNSLSSGPPHTVSIIGMEIDGDGNIILTVQDTYESNGGNINTFKIKITQNYFREEILQRPSRPSDNSIIFNDDTTGNSVILGVSISINISVSGPDCCDS